MKNIDKNMENRGYKEVGAEEFKKELVEERKKAREFAERVRAKCYIDKAEDKIIIESESNILVMPPFDVTEKLQTLMIGLRERGGIIKISKERNSDHFWIFITRKEALNLMYQLKNILKK